jgi:hypothetical protein
MFTHVFEAGYTAFALFGADRTPNLHRRRTNHIELLSGHTDADGRTATG